MSLLSSYRIIPYVSFVISSKNLVVHQCLASVLIQSLLALVSPSDCLNSIRINEVSFLAGFKNNKSIQLASVWKSK